MRHARTILVALCAVLFSAPHARASDGQEVGAAIEAIQQLRDSGDVEGAARRAEKLIDAHPRDLQAHVAHQDLQNALGHTKTVLAAYRARARGGDATADDHYLYARLLSGGAAVTEFRAALKKDENHFWSLCGMGSELTQMGNEKSALAALEKAREVGPDSGVPPNLLGRLAEVRGERWEAEKHYRAAIAIDPDLIVARVNLGIVLVSRAAHEEAQKELLEAERRAPHDPMTHLALGMAYTSAGDGEKAVAAFEQALASGGGSPLTLGLLANAYLNLERYDLAEEALDRAVEIDAEYAPTYVIRSRLHLAREELEQARDAAEEALSIDSKLAEARYMLGLAYEREGRAKKAESEYRVAARAEPQNAVYPRALALLYEGQGRWKEAVRAHESVVDLTDASSDSLFDLAMAQWNAKKPSAAARTLETLVSAEPDELRAWMNLGLIRQNDLRDKKGAEAAYAEYIDRGGDDDRVREWLRELRSK